ncbi:MAG: DUF2975 domain-containing protein [Rhodobacteraceae bacterium]|nr:DUF2975 domain-containing protein [Paracoccaceae bacterium]
MPRPYPSERMQRIARFSRRVAVALLAVMVLTWGLIAYISFGDPEGLLAHPWLAQTGFDLGAITPIKRVAVFAALIVAALPYQWGLFELWRMFRAFSAGDVLTPASVAHFRRFAVALTLGVFSSPVGSGLMSLALSIGMPPGQRAFAIAFSSESLLSGMLGAAMIVVGWVLGEAVAAADENRSFV